MIKLYGYPRSRSTRVAWMLEELDVDYEFIKVDLMKGGGQAAAYLNIHAGGKVPAIDDDGFVLTESGAIVTYLGDKWPALALVPEPKTKQRALYDEGCFFVLSELEQPLWTVGKHKFVFPKDKRVSAVFDVAHWEFVKACSALEKKLDGKEYALGNRFSAVDILIGHTLSWAKAFSVSSDSESLNDYRDRICARVSLGRALTKEDSSL